MGDAGTINSIPHLRQLSGGCQLIVDGRPFLMLPAELHNSSFSCPAFMQQIWPKLKRSNVNTLLASVGWEDIEPVEGIFDFNRFDQVLNDARRHGFRLVLLWFGAFKNGKSTYAPRWVKTNPSRFPRMMVRTTPGRVEVTDVLSILSPAVVEADAAAFAALMEHVRVADSRHCTVLMAQVENEVGLLGDSRDASPAATAQFSGLVPDRLTEMLTSQWHQLHGTLRRSLQSFEQRRSKGEHLKGSWTETFGDSLSTDELFMAYHYASYVEQVASAGRAKYALPLFTNVWQNYADEDSDKSQPVVVGGGGQPGDYPSGGGVINVLDVWQHFAPTLDFIAPDVYLNEYDAVCAKYRHGGQPLFVPEQRRDEYGARRIWSAYGTHHALGASPFGIDSLEPEDSPWSQHFGLLSRVSRELLAAQEDERDSFGFFFDDFHKDAKSSDFHQVKMDGWTVTIERAFVFGLPSPGFGMIIQLSVNGFLLVGEGFQVGFSSTCSDTTFNGILAFTEKVFDTQSGELRTGRSLNGDETRSGQLAIMPSAQPDLGSFPICITIPARSRVAEVELYAF